MLAIVGVVPFAGFAASLIRINMEALRTAHQERQRLLVESIAGDLDVQFEGLRSELVRTAQTLGAGTRGRRMKKTEATQVLEGVADERLSLLRYQFIDGDDIAEAESSPIPESLEPYLQEGLRRAAEFTMEAGETEPGRRSYVSDPIVIDDDGPRRAVAVVSAPVYHDSHLRGVLSGVVDLQRLWMSARDRRRDGHTLYAVSANGKVFASTDPVVYRPGFHYDSPLVERFRQPGTWSRATMPFTNVDETGNEQAYIGSFDITHQGWGVFVVARAEELYAPVRRLIRNTALSALLALAIAVCAAAVFARSLSGPINRLVDATRAFAHGDFSERVSIRSQNELGLLAGTFNQMADQIEDHIQQLRDAAEENNQLFRGTIRALAQAIDAKDPYTRGHSLRVNSYSVIIARHMGLPEDEVEKIDVASLLHDVGKIGIDDAVLKKPGRLTDAEFEVIKRHPVLGAEIMAPIPQMRDVIPGLRWHHEKFGGGGYPDGLIGEQIPLMARIIAVADTFDAMTTHRPYQTAMTYAQALERINTVLTGSALDPNVVAAFNLACDLGRIRPRAELQRTDPQNLETIAVAAASSST